MNTDKSGWLIKKIHSAVSTATEPARHCEEGILPDEAISSSRLEIASLGLDTPDEHGLHLDKLDASLDQRSQ